MSVNHTMLIVILVLMSVVSVKTKWRQQEYGEDEATIDAIQTQLNSLDQLGFQNKKLLTRVDRQDAEMKTMMTHIAEQDNTIHNLLVFFEDHSRLQDDREGCIDQKHNATVVAFFVRGHANTSGDIVYGDVMLNVGGAYSVGTGRFTSPMGGVYTFSYSGLADYASCGGGFVWLSLYLNGAEQSAVRGQYTASVGASVTLELVVGDQVWVGLAGACGVLYNTAEFNTFSGVLVH